MRCTIDQLSDTWYSHLPSWEVVFLNFIFLDNKCFFLLACDAVQDVRCTFFFVSKLCGVQRTHTVKNDHVYSSSNLDHVNGRRLFTFSRKRTYSRGGGHVRVTERS